jgi:hypothetical protein
VRHVAIAGLPASLVLFGCSHLQPSAPRVPQSGPSPTTAQAPGGTVPGRTGAPATPPPDVAAGQPTQSSAQAPPGGAAKPSGQPAKGPTPARPGNGNPKPSTQRNSSGAPAAAAGAGAGSSNTNRTSAPPTPTLDLASLEARLKDTRAIGLFTKLSLKNQVDDLLGQLRAFHAKRTTTSLGELRQRYDLLLLKVLSLLQDGDPSLATAISSSRDAIWGILADPQKFAKL